MISTAKADRAMPARRLMRQPRMAISTDIGDMHAGHGGDAQFAIGALALVTLPQHVLHLQGPDGDVPVGFMQVGHQRHIWIDAVQVAVVAGPTEAKQHGHDAAQRDPGQRKN